ncbi:hypothetical protein [Paraburkholderia saeva]|uniref:Uncharacterized protein n=1 Tax=Paraburkholderia saeva TaxID=2777537 RepID=A0A9N8RW72_9BURK|nr:hypothetical protein [Paraburkholderia saeva]CAG4900600.1 hypothetical protein LMG31841_02896 [Paraburkholderia saeva]
MDLPQIDGADPTPVIAAALGVLFQTHPDREALYRAWQPIAAAMSLIAIQTGSTNVSHNANVVIAQALLHVARTGDGPAQSENPATPV